MTTDENIRDVKPQYDINIEAAKISVLSSGKINRHEYSTGEEMLPSIQKKQQKRLNLLILLWEKVLKKATKRIGNQGKKQVDAITNQGKNLEALTNKDHDHKYKEILK